MRFKSKSRGFSLIELIIVVAIAMVLVALTVPTILRTLHTFQLNAAARNISILVQSARFNAVKQDRNIGFAVNPNGTRFYVDPCYAPVPASLLSPAGPCASPQPSPYYPTLVGTDPQLVDTGNINLVTSGAPSFSTMPFPVAPVLMVPASSTTDSVLMVFSPRGTVTSSSNTEALVFENFEGAYVAVTITITGTTRVWTYQGSAWK